MISRSTLVLLRVPFSYFLLPVYLFGLCAAQQPVLWKALLVFFILHFLLYPASNSFNSYYDRDTDSIGGVKRPPRVHKDLLPISLLLDAAAVGLGFLIGWEFSLSVFIYGLCSKAYSWDKLRLKKYPLTGLLGTALVPGGMGFLMTLYGVEAAPSLLPLTVKALWGALLAVVFLFSFYPMTQIYQHEEDGKRGDLTLSLVLGIRGTFIFSAIILAFSLAGFFAYLWHFSGLVSAGLFLGFLAVPAVFFFHWMAIAFRDPAKADYDHAMRLNLLSSTALNVFFAIFIGARLLAPALFA
ncbi:MAG: UbiA prenyltransferase family protein [Spirochaetales bacterium]|nr:UbiA prenyltransferase family protein [Spirochaetales bacterium]